MRTSSEDILYTVCPHSMNHDMKLIQYNRILYESQGVFYEKIFIFFNLTIFLKMLNSDLNNSQTSILGKKPSRRSANR